jgi:peptidoglycan/LPS O-acetylase OafA/YrhL
MSHALAEKVLKILLPPERLIGLHLPLRLGMICAYLLSVLGLASILYYAVEIPARNRLRKLIQT